MKTYIVCYHPALMEAPHQILEGVGVKEWFLVWPGLMFFRGDQNEKYYAEEIEQELVGKKPLFLVHEYDSKIAWGQMATSLWGWVQEAEAP